MLATTLTDIHGPFVREGNLLRQAEAWVYRALAPRLLRMAGLDGLAERLEADQGDEALWRLHFYGFTAAEEAARRLPGFGLVPEGASDFYKESLATIHRFRQPVGAGRLAPIFGLGWVTTLLCGLRYHPGMPEMLEEIHAYADGDGYASPDWRVAEPPAEDFPRGFGPISVRYLGERYFVRATGRSSTRVVWRLYRTPEGTGHVGDLVVSTSSGYVPLANIYPRRLPDLVTSCVGIMEWGELRRVS